MNSREQGNAFTQFGYYTAMVTQMAMSMVGGVVLGYWLDGKFGIFPILTVVGTILGMAVGFKNFVQMINYFKRKDGGTGRSSTEGEQKGEE